MQNALMGLLKFVLGKKKGRKEGSCVTLVPRGFLEKWLILDPEQEMRKVSKDYYWPSQIQMLRSRVSCRPEGII